MRYQCRRTASSEHRHPRGFSHKGSVGPKLPSLLCSCGGTNRSVLPPSLQSSAIVKSPGSLCLFPFFSLPSPPIPHLRLPPPPVGCSACPLPPTCPSPAERHGAGGGGEGGGRLQPAGGAGPAPGGRSEQGGVCHWPRRGATPARLPHASDTGARRGYLRHPPAPLPPLRARRCVGHMRFAGPRRGARWARVRHPAGEDAAAAAAGGRRDHVRGAPRQAAGPGPTARQRSGGGGH